MNGRSSGSTKLNGRRGGRVLYQYIVALTWVVGHGASATPATHDIVIRHGMIYDGTGGLPFVGDVAIDGDRLTYVGPHRALKARKIIDATGRAISPGFIDMMGHSEESLLIDGRAVSGLKQGVTMDVFTETSKGPLTPEMARLMVSREGDLILMNCNAKAFRRTSAASSVRAKCASTYWARPTSRPPTRNWPPWAVWCGRQWKKARSV